MPNDSVSFGSRVIRVEIKPELLSWARERAGYDLDALAHRFPKLAAWEQGTAQPTLKQIEKFASATNESKQKAVSGEQ